MKAHRLARVREVIREVASETILFDLKDPRVRNVIRLNAGGGRRPCREPARYAAASATSATSTIAAGSSTSRVRSRGIRRYEMF